MTIFEWENTVTVWNESRRLYPFPLEWRLWVTSFSQCVLSIEHQDHTKESYSKPNFSTPNFDIYIAYFNQLFHIQLDTQLDNWILKLQLILTSVSILWCCVKIILKLLRALCCWNQDFSFKFSRTVTQFHHCNWNILADKDSIDKEWVNSFTLKAQTQYP